ncbi:MAG: polymer-forming cytoskeletal protein [Gammaproteobacteria bacterium]|nr:polymer-forming cytoskeletal protein [Gammaproteobacteria bacterium]
MFGWGKKTGKLPKITTVIGSGTEIRGDVHFHGGLHVDGKVLGTITANPDEQSTLVLSELGEIRGDIHVPNVVLNGEVHGDVHASNRVELASKASIHGTVYYRFLEMMMGAVVNGQLVRADEESSARPLYQPGAPAVADAGGETAGKTQTQAVAAADSAGIKANS